MNLQLWKLAQARLAMHAKPGSDVIDRGAIQIGDLPATAFTHDDMEDQASLGGRVTMRRLAGAGRGRGRGWRLPLLATSSLGVFFSSV